MNKKLIEKYNNTYTNNDIRAVRSPLRICPIGAHSDHQEGIVTGMSLDASIDLIYSPNLEGIVNVHSLDFEGVEKFHLTDDLEFIPKFWGNYLRGAVTSLKRDYNLTKGINGVIGGSLPIGGLSSSAAVITAYLMALCDVNGINLSKLELVHYNSQAEREFMGLKNGILDQSSNILSKNNHLMVMDCQTDEYQLIQKGSNLPEFEVVVVFSGVTKQLTDSDFNNRTDECRVAGWLMQELESDSNKITALDQVRLRNIPRETYNKHKSQLPGRFGRRAEHFYTEQGRVADGAKAWSEGDMETFGQLMFESGDSTFYNYETGIPEMKTIFDVLRNTKGVYGARPSGAGFRGSVIGLINPKYKEKIRSAIEKVFPNEHPKYSDVYEVNFVKTADGASYVKNLEDFKMKGLILAAGYATRLYPLTKNTPKPLLEVSGKTILDYIVEEMDKVAVLNEIIIVTNQKFTKHFEDWKKETEYSKKITVVNDGTTTNDNRLGAIGDIQYVIDSQSLNDDLMVLAGDNLFDFNLVDFANYFKEVSTDIITAYSEESEEQRKRAGIVELDEKSKVKSFEEKPKHPKSKFTVPAFYLYKKETLPEFKTYIEAGYNSDAPGHFIPYLIKNKTVHAFQFEGNRYDIGTLESYERVKKKFASR